MSILQMKESEEEEVVVHFLEVIQSLLEDPDERQDFFLVSHYHLHLCGAKHSCTFYFPL